MRRKALIIGNPGQPGSGGYCDGVNKDIANYKRFFQSPNGGSWDESEIETMVKPSTMQLRSALSTLGASDYAVIIFSGHGYFSERSRSTILELNATDEIDSTELRAGTPKQTLVLDCCRVVSPSTLLEKATELAIKSADRLNWQECRRYYNQSIEKCPPSLVVMHACAVGETAGDDSANGGYYLHSLLEIERKWSEAKLREIDLSKDYAILNVSIAHERAAEMVRERSARRQNPSIEKPKSENQFPFAIVA